MSSRNFKLIFLADFLVRSAYQMGKTPLLPIFAASLGATDLLLGSIVAVSTLTGMLFKPLFGIFSDRWGRRLWLIVGTAFFALVPFLYRFVDTPEQLALVRIIHGTATAIYGPVTVAYVAELSLWHRGEQLGWFSIARTGGYIVGPLLAGWLLLYVQPETVFTVIGLLSLLAFVPVFMLSESSRDGAARRMKLTKQAAAAVSAGIHTPAIWLSGGLEAATYVALYASKAFLPVYALSIGVNVAVVGLFFALQEAIAALARPFGGRAGDRLGFRSAISLGMAIIGLALALLTLAQGTAGLLALAVCFGLGQGLVFPSTVALVADQIRAEHLGAGMGLLGTLDNAGKVAGPILAGLLIAWLNYVMMFRILGGLLLAGSLGVWLWRQWDHRRQPVSAPLSTP